MKPNDIGILGENLVAQWLQAQGWEILHQRWRCRWGELDIIAQQPVGTNTSTDAIATPYLVFVEVKTRSQGNWDADGLLAIAAPKQAKLLHAAQLFLAQRADLAEFPCRFDVALVSYQPRERSHRIGKQTCCSPPVAAAQHQERQKPSSIGLGQAAEIAGYQLILQDYIQSAFDNFDF